MIIAIIVILSIYLIKGILSPSVIDYKIESIRYIGSKTEFKLKDRDVKDLEPYLKKVYAIDKFDYEKKNPISQCMPLFRDYLFINEKNKLYYSICGGKYNNQKVDVPRIVYDKINEIIDKYE